MDYSEWRFDGESPIYIQLYHYLRCSILSGCMKPGEPLPSVRWLASLLHFNANTVARAYNPTSKDGLVEMSRGKAGRVTSNSTLIHVERQRAVKNLCSELLETIKSLGFSKEEILVLIEEATKT